jgi:NhaP-type Na+/H+ or K+/H+ antiporter
MHESTGIELLAVVAACVVVWGVVSGRFERWNVTAPMAFVVLGFLVANEPLALVDVPIRSDTVREIAEVTLALVLFADASRVNVGALRRDVAIPLRLLLVGLPITIGMGTAVALVLFAGGDRSSGGAHRRGARCVDHGGPARTRADPARAQRRERSQ